MAASLQLRPQNRDLGMMVRDVDEDLAIYLGVRNVEEQIIDDHLLNEDLDDSKELRLVQMATDDELLNLETDKGDGVWLLTQPNLSVIPAIETKGQDPVVTETSSSVEAISLKSELGNACEESDSSGKPQANKRPSSSGTRKPSSRSLTPSNTQQSLPAKSKTSRPSTPTSRATFPSSKPTKAVQTRSSTPNKAATSSRSSAQVARTSLTAGSKSSSRSSTPTRKTSLPSSEPDSSSNGPKVMSKSQMVVKSRPSSDILSKSHNASQSLKMSVPKRPVSASRGRPSSTNTSSSNAKSRQKSCSPAKTRVPVATSGNKTGNVVMLSRSRGYRNDGDNVNPVVIGTKMVERVVNMRKLAPPKQDDQCVYNDKPKKSSKDNSGFGRSLSNKSLDMALRHMDIRRSIPENLRPVATSLANGVKTRSAKSETTAHDVSESPLTSSGSDSSKYSVDSSKSSIYHFLNNGSEMDQSSSYES